MVITISKERIRIIGVIGFVFMLMIITNFLLSLADDDVVVVKVSKPIDHESIHKVAEVIPVEMPVDGNYARILVKKGKHKTVYKVQWWSLNSNEWVTDSNRHDNLSDAEKDRDSWISYQRDKYLDMSNTGEWVIHDE